MPVVVTEVAPKVNGVGMVTVPVKVGDAIGAYAVLVYALVPSVPPPPMLRVEPSVPARVRVFDDVNVLPAAIFKVFVPFAVTVSPFTVVGVIAPRVRVIAGVVVAVATEPETPFAVVTDTLVTVPIPAAKLSILSLTASLLGAIVVTPFQVVASYAVSLMFEEVRGGRTSQSVCEGRHSGFRVSPGS